MCRTAPDAACRRWRRRPGSSPARRRRPRASTRRSRCSTRTRRRSTPTSTAPRPSCSACRSSRVFEALSVYMGSAYINDFNILGRTYQVTAQADNPFRLTPRDVENLKTRNATGDMVPIGSVATFRDTTGPFRVPRYNLYPAAEVQFSLARGFSTGQGIAAIEKIAAAAAAAGLRLRMDRNRAAGKARRQHGGDRLRAGGGVRVPAAGGAVRKLAAAAGGGADRADVHPGGDDRRERSAASTATSWWRSGWWCWSAWPRRTPS